MSLSIIRYPSGRYGFVGKVPAVLAYDSDHEGDLCTAAQYGPGIARRIAEREGRHFYSLSWSSEELARQAAEAFGYKVDGE